MNFLKRLFKREIRGVELNKLLSALEMDNEFIDSLYSPVLKQYNHNAYGKVDVKKTKEGVSFDLDVTDYFHQHPIPAPNTKKYLEIQMHNIKKTISYDELNKNPVLKKYVKGKNLEKSLSILSIGLVLASTFFISNNITGNAILTNTAESSGFVGAGLFVLGLVSFILAKNI